MIIILTIATGTGLHQEEIHVLDPKKYMEIDVENPSNIIKQKVNTKIVDKGNNVAIHIIIGDQVTYDFRDSKYRVKRIEFKPYQ